MALTALPSDCLLACLARVPYVDLRNTIPSTCKSLRDAVTSAALRKTREAAGWTEWAVFAGRYAVRTHGFIITASGARRTALRPHIRGEFAMRASLSSDQDEVVLMECENGSVRACVFGFPRARVAYMLVPQPLFVCRASSCETGLPCSSRRLRSCIANYFTIPLATIQQSCLGILSLAPRWRGLSMHPAPAGRAMGALNSCACSSQGF